MKANLFSPVLIILILTLIVKASQLAGRIQEQTMYASDTGASSILVDTAFASTTNKKPAQRGNTTPTSEPKERKPTISDKGAKIEDTIQDIKVVEPTVKTQAFTNQFSKSEVTLLKELSKRRQKLDEEEQKLNTREQILKATESKIDMKVKELKTLQAQLEALMKKYDQKEHSKILSLVKIYENMKPKDAAKIFNELEMPVLLRVVRSMKEVKVAPVIAAMDASKARELSIELAKQNPIK